MKANEFGTRAGGNMNVENVTIVISVDPEDVKVAWYGPMDFDKLSPAAMCYNADHLLEIGSGEAKPYEGNNELLGLYKITEQLITAYRESSNLDPTEQLHVGLWFTNQEDRSEVEFVPDPNWNRPNLTVVEGGKNETNVNDPKS